MASFKEIMNAPSEVKELKKKLEYITLPKNKVEDKNEGLLTSQDFSTNFKEVNMFSEFVDNQYLNYRYHYINGTSKWFEKSYNLGFNKQNYHYAKRIVREYSRYIFKDIDWTWLEEQNVLNEKEANDLIKEVLLYKKVLVRYIQKDEVLIRKVYYGNELDKQNNVLIELDGLVYKEYWNSIENAYKYTLMSKIDNKEKDKSQMLNANAQTQNRQMDFLFYIDSDSDIIADAMSIMHVLDVVNSNIHYQLSVEPTLISMPETMIKSFKKGVRAYRKFDTYGLSEGEKPLLPESITPESRVNELREFKRELKDELSELTSINFLSDVNGNNQTATEYAGKQKPFVQLINDFNIIFEPMFDEMITALIEYYNLNTTLYDGFETPPYVVQDVSAMITDIVKLGGQDIPSVQSKLLSMLLGLSEEEEQELKLEIEEVKGIGSVDIQEVIE